MSVDPPTQSSPITPHGNSLTEPGGCDGPAGHRGSSHGDAASLESSGSRESSSDEVTDADARSRLLNQAGPVFARSGFDRATIREICGAANVNVASVAYYFGDKMGLYRSVVAQIRDTRERRFPSPPNLGDVEPEVALVRLIHTMLSRMLKSDPSGWETQLLMREMDHPTVVFQELVNDFFRPVFDQLKSTIVRLIGRGAVDSDFDANAIDESVVEQFALSVVGQCLYYRLGRGVIDVLIPRGRQQESFDIDSLCQHIAAVTLSAAHNASFLHQKRELAPLIEQFKATVGSDVTAHRAESGNPLSSKPNIDK